MKKKNLIKTLFIAALFSLPVFGYAQSISGGDPFNFKGTQAGTGGFGKTMTKFNQLANVAFYTMYLVGGAMLTGGAIKLKQGDVAGFSKMAAGGGVLFTIPTVMKGLQDYSDK